MSVQNRKAVRIRKVKRTEGRAPVRLAQRTDVLRLLRAFAAGYDPGIKLENASTEKPKHKKQCQFRVASKNIATLYESVETVAV